MRISFSKHYRLWDTEKLFKHLENTSEDSLTLETVIQVLLERGCRKDILALLSTEYSEKTRQKRRILDLLYQSKDLFTGLFLTKKQSNVIEFFTGASLIFPCLIVLHFWSESFFQYDLFFFITGFLVSFFSLLILRRKNPAYFRIFQNKEKETFLEVTHKQKKIYQPFPFKYDFCIIETKVKSRYGILCSKFWSLAWIVFLDSKRKVIFSEDMSLEEKSFSNIKIIEDSHFKNTGSWYHKGKGSAPLLKDIHSFLTRGTQN